MITVMKFNKIHLFLSALGLISAILLSLPFLVPHTGFLSLVAFIPLLIMERLASGYGVRHFWIYHYSTFVLWNAMTTFWVCNATVGGGLFAIFANAFQMSLVFGLFRYSRKSFSGVLPYIFLMTAWIAWERAYFDAEISWPWLVLGNAFAGSIKSVQWYEYTGTLGGSLWIWLSNLSIFGLMVSLSDGRWAFRFNMKAKAASAAGIVLLLAGPFVWSAILYNSYTETERPFDVLVLQPNFDPYEKFQALDRNSQNMILLDLAANSLSDRKSVQDSSSQAQPPMLVLAPETFTNDVITNDVSSGRTWNRIVSFLGDYPGVNFLFGASSYTYMDSSQRPSYTARQVRDGRWIESHNSALIVDAAARTQLFHKNKLVVAVEKTPYPAVFCKIDDMLGGVMGRCIGQDSVSVITCKSPGHADVKTGCAICYESVYGEYFTGYVSKGAEFMTVITNDAWWGDTPGYRQHLNYASLRAVETRRSIARCANTGISAFIDQKGDVVQSTSWWNREVLRGKINLNDKLTFFVRYGDVTGRLCSFVFCLLLAALAVRRLSGNRK